MFVFCCSLVISGIIVSDCIEWYYDVLFLFGMQVLYKYSRSIFKGVKWFGVRYADLSFVKLIHNCSKLLTSKHSNPKISKTPQNNLMSGRYPMLTFVSCTILRNRVPYSALASASRVSSASLTLSGFLDASLQTTCKNRSVVCHKNTKI